MKYDNALTLREARARFFSENGFSEDQYGDRVVTLTFGRCKVWFPNTRSRQRAVRLHDLHHVLTEYGTSWTGEAEISAWELGSGCRDYGAAWVLNGLGLLMGVAIAPLRTLRAFLHGRRTDNLYGNTVDDALLNERLGVLRKRLRLQREA